MPWANVPNAGFCPPGVEPWLPITPDLTRVNVASQLDDPSSMLSLTRRLLALRRASPALARGSYRSLDWPGVPPECYLFEREDGAERLLVALNFSDQPEHIPIPDGRSAALLISTDPDRDGSSALTVLDLRPGEGCIFRLEGR